MTQRATLLGMSLEQSTADGKALMDSALTKTLGELDHEGGRLEAEAAAKAQGYGTAYPPATH